MSFLKRTWDNLTGRGGDAAEAFEVPVPEGVPTASVLQQMSGVTEAVFTIPALSVALDARITIGKPLRLKRPAA